MYGFPFSVLILRMELFRVFILGKFSLWLNCLEDISVGRVFLRGGGARFLAIIQKTITNYIKKLVFSTENNEQH